MNTDELIDRFDKLIELGHEAIRRGGVSSDYRTSFPHAQHFGQFRSASISLLRNVFGANHSFEIEFRNYTKRTVSAAVNMGIGTLKAARNEIEQGWIFKLTGLVSSQIFNDFMQMAGHLLDENYKDPAAVMIGCVLEQRMKELADARSIPIVIDKPDGRTQAKSTDRINADLVKDDAYGATDHKQVTAWLALRNHAAHGEWDKYTHEQIKTMYQGVSEFLSRITP